MKKIGIIATIIVVIIIIILIGALIIIKNTNQDLDYISEEKAAQLFENANKMDNIKNASEYFNIKAVINLYRNSIQNKKNTIQLLPEFVINELNLNEENVNNTISFPNGLLKINSLMVSHQTIDTVAYEMTTDVRLYNVKLSIINESNVDMQLFVLLDYINSTYYIIPQEYIQAKNIKIDDGQNISLYQTKEIKPNEANVFETIKYTDEDIAKEYFNLYKIDAIYNTETSYNMVESECKKNKFDTLEKYKEIIEKISLKSAYFVDYKVTINNGNKEYTVADQRGNTYIFKENGVSMKATVTLNDAIEQINNKVNISNNDYFIVKNCIQTYVDAINKKNPNYYDKEGRNFQEKKLKETVNKLLSQNYINQNRINTENIYDYINLLDEKSQFYPTNIEIIGELSSRTYKVEGIIQNLEYKNSKRVYFILNIDSLNKTFSVMPVSNETYQNYNNLEYLDIENNTTNKYEIEKNDTKAIAIECMSSYKVLTLANPQYTYERMTEEYRNKRFGSFDNYKQYIKDNSQEILDISPQKYMEENNEVIIKDQYENIYIFDTKSLINYKVQLDTYTMGTQSFDKSYDNADDAKKVQMNIGKFIQMINRHDYKTSYNCLADSFKNNKMKKEEDFKNFIQKGFFSYNKIEYTDYKEIGNKTYMYKIKIKDLSGKDSKERKATIIMQLLENRKFQMSLSLE